MQRLLLHLAVFLVASPAMYGGVCAGVSLGYQPYQAGDAARFTRGAEVALTVGRVGMRAAGEYTNRSYLGTVTGVHLDGIYAAPLGDNMKASFGAGLTRVNAEATELGTASKTTWNISAELSKRLDSAELFARLRYFTYAFAGFRGEAPGSPAGPAVSIGVRYWFR